MSNNILLVDGTAKSFKESGGDVLWTPKNVANGAGRISTQLDLGATRYEWYRWVLATKFQTATVGNAIRLYLVYSDGTYQDGSGLGTSDAGVAAETLLQYAAKQIGPTMVHHATNANIWSGHVRPLARYVSVTIWNASGVALTNTAGDHEFRLQPVNMQVQ